jgi:hypothetical protein
VNESAGEQITELLNDDLLLTDTDHLDATDDADEEPPVRTSREGLPRSFRMRHDAHYVDELMSRAPDGPSAVEHDPPARPALDAAPPPDRRDRPASVPPHAAPSALSAPAAAIALIAGRLESVVAHAGTIRAHQATPAFIAQSVQAEFARVARLARAAAILQDRETPRRRNLTAGAIAERVMTAGAPVARMAGLECEVTVDDPAFTILAEPSLVLQSIAGTVDAVVDLLLADPRWTSFAEGGDPVPRISISLQSVRVRPALILDVICPALFIDGRHAERFFDNVGDDYRAAPSAGILLAAAAHVVRAHGGRADVKRHSGIGATIAYVFPRSVADHGPV